MADTKDDPTLRYGIHAGKRVSELPEDYVMWWCDRSAALKENYVAQAMCARARLIAGRTISDYEPGRLMWKYYDPQDDNDW